MMRLRHKLLIHAFRVFAQLMLIGTLLVLVAVVSEHGRFAFVKEFLVGSHPSREVAGVTLLLLCWTAIFNALVHYDANRFTSLSTALLGLIHATTLSAFVLFM